MPKHTGLLREFTAPLKVCYEKRTVNDGWIPNGHATRQEEGFTYSIFQEYKSLGFESTPKTDNSDYTKDAQIPLYLGLIEGRGHNNTEKRITPQGIKMYEAIVAEDPRTQYEILIKAFESKSFGRNNQGFPSADSDVEVPNVLLLSSILLDGVTRQEFYSMLFLMHTKGWDLARAVTEIVYIRKSGSTLPETPTIYTDCKLIPLFVSMQFLTEDAQKRLHINTSVYNEFAKRILRLKSRNKEEMKPLLEENSENENETNEVFCTRQIIYFGTPGSGKSFKVSDEIGETPYRTIFHPDTDYASFVGSYKPVGEGENIGYKFVSQVFTDAYIEAWKKPNTKVNLVIEEINRGNCAQIFGDLFQLLDRKNGYSEYEVTPNRDLKDHLAKEFSFDEDVFIGRGYDEIKEKKVLKGEIMILPNNLSIYATMNTSDQSLFPMDSAFKRRWDWEYVPVCYDETTENGKENKASQFRIIIDENFEEGWLDFLKGVNEKIKSVTCSEDKQMGNYFIKDNVDASTFINKVMYYLWSEVCKEEYKTDKNFFRWENSNEEVVEFSFNELFPVNEKSKSILKSFIQRMIAEGK